MEKTYAVLLYVSVYQSPKTSAFVCNSVNSACQECTPVNADSAWGDKYVLYDCKYYTGDGITLVNKIGTYIVICELIVTVLHFV